MHFRTVVNGTTFEHRCTSLHHGGCLYMVSGGRSLAPNEESVRLLTCSSRHQPLRVSLSALGTSASGWFTFYGKSVEIKSEEEKKNSKTEKIGIHAVRNKNEITLLAHKMIFSRDTLTM